MNFISLLNNDNFKYLTSLDLEEKYPKFNKNSIDDILNKCFGYMIQSSNLKILYKFHIFSNKKHYLFVFKILNEAFPVKLDTAVYSFSDAKQFKDGPKKEEEFIIHLQNHCQIVTDFPLIQESIVERDMNNITEEDNCNKKIMKKFNINKSNINFFLSEEMINGIKWKREDSHKVDQELIHACLEKKIKVLEKVNHIKDAKQNKRFVFYFKVPNSKVSNILKLVVDSAPPEGKSCYIITAFFITNFKTLKELSTKNLATVYLNP